MRGVIVDRFMPQVKYIFWDAYNYNAMALSLQWAWSSRLDPRHPIASATSAVLLWKKHQVSVRAETPRRWLHQEGLVWRRPWPVLRRSDPQPEKIPPRLSSGC